MAVLVCVIVVVVAAALQYALGYYPFTYIRRRR